ncbi:MULTISPECIES: hypothetical protein [Enterobacter cloacae complex]|jgi:hypothetical protein|uniref:hypothetical protein n=1 Tax=Enterobacter cloacae complex TaxID=354276 RepID=UPI0007B3AEBF|nr:MULTISPECIES: hypothetical protein [Enterobacter cloacae complex]HCS2231387.1 hypothetical protein [Shigella sonnei]HDR2628152.1 hypothetical protein [Enterobacter cancerogenus]HDT4166056.1 hypothetical protein [Enterobacter hormaechei subsp. steigerwaltii]HEL5909249.1 hypothetical protein [Escherichia coli]ELG6444274.1 hypothetical protein [Enterobacter cloacae]
MKLDAQTRDALRQYKKTINAQRRENGLREIDTARVVEEIIEFVRCQQAVYIAGVYIRQS